MSSEQNNNTREEFKVELDPIPFEPIGSVMYISSSKVAELTHQILRQVFADSEGCIFSNVNNIISLTALFNHNKYDEDAILACCRGDQQQGTGRSVIDVSRQMDSYLRNGDRYIITEDGKDFFKKLLLPSLTPKGKVNWGNVVGEYVDRTQYSIWSTSQNTPHYTTINGLDVNMIARMIWGDEDEGGEPIVYNTTVLSAIGMPMNGVQNYMLAINRIYDKGVKATYQAMGFNNIGSPIIRAK